MYPFIVKIRYILVKIVYSHYHDKRDETHCTDLLHLKNNISEINNKSCYSRRHVLTHIRERSSHIKRLILLRENYRFEKKIFIINNPTIFSLTSKGVIGVNETWLDYGPPVTVYLTSVKT